MLWYMLMYLNILLHDLHDRRPIWSDMTYPCSEGKTGCWRLWSTMYSLQTLLPGRQDFIYFDTHGHCSTVSGLAKLHTLAVLSQDSVNVASE